MTIWNVIERINRNAASRKRLLQEKRLDTLRNRFAGGWTPDAMIGPLEEIDHGGLSIDDLTAHISI